MNEIERIYQTAPNAKSFAKGYLDYLGNLLKRLDLEEVAQFVQVLFGARERGSRIFFIGNGGSAATASHFANDIAIGSRAWSKPFRALSLTDNLAILTAIGNDYGYDQIFTRQLQTQMTSEDVVVAISASGNSPNIIHAVNYANSNGAVTISLTGFNGGKLKDLTQFNVHVPTNKGEYGHTEDVHMVLDHLVGSFIFSACKVDGGDNI